MTPPDGPIPGRHYIEDTEELARALAAFPGRVDVTYREGPMAAALAAVPGAGRVLGEIAVLRAVRHTPPELRQRREILLEEAERVENAHGDPDTAAALRRHASTLERLAHRTARIRATLDEEGYRLTSDGAVTLAPSGDGRPRHLFRRLVVELHSALGEPPLSNRKDARERIALLLAPYFAPDPDAIQEALRAEIRKRRK